MSGSQVHDSQWLKERINRHVGEIVRLAAPAVMMRLGIMTLGIVDTAMVGHYATEHLAWLNLANQSLIMFTLVVGLGLVSGVLIMCAAAFGQDDFEECGRVWRRSLPFAFIAGLIMLAICYPAEYWLTLMGISAEKAAESGGLIRILSYGLIPHLLFACCIMFMEGIKRPEVGFKLMIGANVINVIVNYALIFGNWGMPEMGAEGSAWASTAVRWFMALSAIAYVWYAPSLNKYKLRLPFTGGWRSWSEQRQIGYASSVSLAAEVAAFSALAIFAGWIGTVALAAHGIIHQLLSLPFMIAIGVGVASSVRVGIAFSRKDRLDVRIGGWTGVVIGFVMLSIFALIIFTWGEKAIFIFTADTAVFSALLPLIFLMVITMIFDGLQMILSITIRGMREKWWPTAIQAFSYLVVMIPVCYYLGVEKDFGLWGLVLGTLIGSITSTLLQGWFFHHLTKSTARQFN